MELLNRAQNSRVNDQRGLLSKEDLILPDFLQVPEQGGVTCTSHSSSSPENCTLKAAKAGTSQRQSQVQSQPQVSPSSPLQIPTSSSSAAAGKSVDMWSTPWEPQPTLGPQLYVFCHEARPFLSDICRSIMISQTCPLGLGWSLARPHLALGTLRLSSGMDMCAPNVLANFH